MYPPPHHQIRDREKMISVIKHFPLGMLVTAANERPFVTHMPVIYNEGSGKLVAHIDASNPQVKTLVNGREATVIFRGPDTYISPSVYTTEQLPTWNYIIVHISGTIQLIEDEEAVKQTLIDMTRFLEGSEQKYVLEAHNPKMQRLVNYIRAFEITITNWEGKFKLSQDKNEADFHNARNALLKKSKEDLSGFINSMYNDL